MVEIKGLSAVVAMVILIIITITVAGVMAIWAQKYVNEKTENATAQEQRMSQCLKTSINILGTKVDSGNKRIILTIENNGFDDISGLDVKIISPDGDVCSLSSDPPLDSTLKAGDIGIYKITYTCSAGNYTMYIVPSGCLGSKKSRPITIP